MRPSLLGCTALASTLVLACTDASAPTGPTSPTVTAKPTSAPTADLVTRFTAPFFDAFADGEFAAVLGVSPAGLAAFCDGDESGLDLIHVQEVSRPDGSIKITARSRPRLLIYPIGDSSGPCDLVGITPLATGKAQLNRTDNDFTVTFNRTNSFGSHLTGNASGDGGRFKVRSQVRITIHKNGEFQVHAQRFGITRLGG
jgi:hypothetical protein